MREDEDVTQDGLARITGTTQKSISDYETGRTRIPIETLIRIAEFFDVSMDYITGVSDIKRKFPRE